MVVNRSPSWCPTLTLARLTHTPPSPASRAPPPHWQEIRRFLAHQWWAEGTELPSRTSARPAARAGGGIFEVTPPAPPPALPPTQEVELTPSAPPPVPPTRDM
eukprot:2721090-Prymnesium_polylepis.1